MARSTKPSDPSSSQDTSIRQKFINDELDLEEGIDGPVPRFSIPIQERERDEEDGDDYYDEDKSIRVFQQQLSFSPREGLD